MPADLFTADNLVAFLTLTGLEVVLGIDNIIFIAILCARLPIAQRDKARIIGLSLAMITRIALLFAISWVMGLDRHKLFDLFGHAFTGKDLVLVLGGLFLVAKSTVEIHHKIETGGAVEAVPHEHPGKKHKAKGFAGVIVQILLIDLVFSLDSVITAVGMVGGESAKRAAHAAADGAVLTESAQAAAAAGAINPAGMWIMVSAVVIAVIVMLLASGYIARFVDRNPTIKMLALSFLILIGVMLIAEGFGQHINKNYIYFAMAFSLGVELLNMWAKRKGTTLRAGAPA